MKNSGKESSLERLQRLFPEAFENMVKGVFQILEEKGLINAQ